MVILAIVLLTLPLAAIYGSVGEWLLHRYVMHRPFFGFRYPYVAHAQTHHRIFGADESYHLGDRDKRLAEKIPMKWWNAPVIIALGGIPVYVAALAAVFLWWPTAGYSIGITSITVWFAYYGVYEFSHWCMHWPKNRWLESSRLFRFLDEHHHRHHKHMGRNFNVVLPIADRLFGTLTPRVT